MKRTRYTAGQIIQGLKTAEQLIVQSKTVADVYPCHRDNAADVSPLAAAVRRDAGRGGQAVDPAGEGERPAQEAVGRSGAGEGDALAAGPAKP